MFEEVRIRERKSVKYGKTYEYRFETAPVGGERKWLSKGGFLFEDEAKQVGIEAWKRYCLPRTIRSSMYLRITFIVVKSTQ